MSVALARLPSIDADPDKVEFSTQSGETAEVKVWIENGGGAQWAFTLAWREESQRRPGPPSTRPPPPPA